jgi:dihydroorotase
MAELLQQVRLLDPLTHRDQLADVRVVQGQIEAIAPPNTLSLETSSDEENQVIDAQGMILGPGLVDLYSYSGEPGHEDRETLVDLTAAAAAGGFTRLHLLPSVIPPLDNPGAVQRLLSLVPTPAPVQVRVWGAITQGLAGEALTDLLELEQAGVVGFCEGRPLQDSVLLRRVLEYLAPRNCPISLWPCIADLTGDGVIREGMEAYQFGLPTVPAYAETAALAALLELVASIGTPVHLMRISTARSVALIAQAKAQGLPITASTPWHHLLLDSEALAKYDPVLRLDPPLGNPSDRLALIEAVRTGVIDAIAIDHRAYTYEEKTVPFAQAPAGALGLALALPLLWQTLVASGQWTALELWRALSSGPAHCLHQTPPQVDRGAIAEMTLFNPSESWVVDGASLHSPQINTHWLQATVQGRVQTTWIPSQ